MSRILSIDWVGHAPSRRTGELLLALWVLSIADLFFTVWAHLFTPFKEMNPIADAMLGRGLIPSLVIYKLTVTLLGTAIFCALRDHARRGSHYGDWSSFTRCLRCGGMITPTSLPRRWPTITIR